jgi:hypothetical protein
MRSFHVLLQIETLSTSFSRFSTNLRATSLMVSQLASRSEDACLGIDKQRDLEAGTNGMRWSREVPLGKVLYQNYVSHSLSSLCFLIRLKRNSMVALIWLTKF